MNGYDKGTGIEKVEFYIDGNLIHTLFDPPYSFTWSTERLMQFDFLNKITAICYDKAGNENEIDMAVLRIF